MRTTIELRNDQRARLLEIAALRGEKGFSGLVQEAVDLLLAEEDRRERSADAALSVLGTLSESEEGEMRRWSEELRARWR